MDSEGQVPIDWEPVAMPPTVTLSNVLNVAKVIPYPVLLDSLATPKYEHILRANFSAPGGKMPVKRVFLPIPVYICRAGIISCGFPLNMGRYLE